MFIVLIAVALLAGSPASRAVQASPRAAQAAVTLRSVTVSPDGSAVSITADGPLPKVIVGQMIAPDRVYVDLSGVEPGALKTMAGGGSISRVRVSRYTTEPLVTRVVVDLVRPVTYRLDLSDRQSGHVTLALDMPASPVSAPGVAHAADPEVTRYLQDVSPLLARLHDLMPALTAIEKLEPSVHTSALEANAVRFDAIRLDLAAIKPPGAPAAVVATHDLLQRACAFGALAARLRASSISAGDPSITANASSAAAGAMLLMMKATEDLAGYRRESPFHTH